MTYAQQIAARKDDDLVSRVVQSIVSAAVSIVGENTTSMSDEKADKRHELGVIVLSGNQQRINAMVSVIITQIGDVEPPYDSITDATIDSAVSSVWDDVSGVKYTESS